MSGQTISGYLWGIIMFSTPARYDAHLFFLFVFEISMKHFMPLFHTN